MPKSFGELRAKMSPELLARSRALADQYRASAERDAAAADIARWFEKLDKFGADPIDRGQQPMLDGSVAPRRRSRRPRR
jgi:hypothetical protein